MPVNINSQTTSDEAALLREEVERLREENTRLKNELAAQGPEKIRWSKWWGRGEDRRDPNPYDDGEEVEQQPYMVTVQASRVSHGGGGVLFDSEHRHRNYIVLRINSASRRRGLSNDWIHADKELIEVALSESQWAHMITSLNHSSGSPATLMHLLQQRVTQPPEPDKRTDKFGPELRKRFEKGLAALDAFMEAGTLSKAKRSQLEAVRRELEANGSFVVGEFEKHMEVRKDKAKTEIEAEMRAAMQRVAESALRSSLSGPQSAPQSAPETGSFYVEGSTVGETEVGTERPAPEDSKGEEF